MFLSLSIKGLDSIPAVLTYEKYLQVVQEHHPISKAAELRIDLGDAILRSARGEFDPILMTDLSRKDFENERYYDLLDAGLKIPTWLGASIDLSYNNNEGIYLNPESKTPQTGLVQMGISLPIGQGLFIDKRRTQLRKAQLSLDMEASNRRIILNDLLYEASIAYWKWFNAYNRNEVYEEAIELAEQRFDAIKVSATLGEKPFVDTLEAGIQVQNRDLMLQEARLSLNNARLLLSTFLWLDGGIPIELEENTLPPPIDSLDITSSAIMGNLDVQELIISHPEIIASRLKIEQLEFDVALRREMLKPKLDLKYNAISEYTNSDFMNFNSDDYVLGLAFEFPVLLRKERGQQKIAELAVMENQLDLQSMTQQFWFNTRSAMNNWDITRSQIDLYETTVTDYFDLLLAERELFNVGESSLFLVNSRELGYVNARVKIIELITKNKIAETTTKYSLTLINPEL